MIGAITMLKGAKPIGVLLSAPTSAQIAMVDFVDYGNIASDLRSDIGDIATKPKN